MRGLIKNVLFTLALWAALWALAEGALRAWEALRPRGPERGDDRLFMCEPHPTRIWHYKAGFRQSFRTPEFSIQVRTGSWRLRDGEVPAEVLDDTRSRRVLALGDSFFFGWGVAEEERFTEILEREPGSKQRPLHVLNAGHWSYTYDQELLLLRELVPRYRPHLVVFGVYPPGLLPLLAHRWGRDGEGRLVACSNDSIRVSAEGLLHFTHDYLDRAPFSSRVVAAGLRIWFNWRLSRNAMTADLALLDPVVTRYEPAWSRAEDILRETGDYLRGEGIPWIAVGVPRDLQVSKREWNQTYQRAAKGASLDPELPMRRLGPMVERAGGRFVDLLPGFRASYRSDLYFDLDPHWTSEGHRLAASLLAPAVRGALEAREARP
jgi:hypothetical protein